MNDDILAKLAEAGCEVVVIPPGRRCLQCDKDLTDVMGVYVFVGGKPVDELLCVEHGSNGSNMLSHSRYDYLTKTPNQRRLYLAGDGDD